MGAVYLATNVAIPSAKPIKTQSTPVLLTRGKQNKEDMRQVGKAKGVVERGMEPASSGPVEMATVSSETTASSPMTDLKEAGEAVAVKQAVDVVAKAREAKEKEKGGKPKPGSSPQWWSRT